MIGHRRLWSWLLVGIAGAALGACAGADSETSDTAGGAPVCPNNQAHLCTIDYACDYDCGGRYPLDDAGCLRPLCADDQDCGADEVCYAPGHWGDCFHADTQCVDDGDKCVCDGASGCATGSFCVPTANLPAPQEIQSEPVSVEDTCMPGGGPGIRLSVGDMAVDGWVLVQIWEPAPLAPGEYTTSGGAAFCIGIGGETVCANGVLVIDSWEGDLVSGSFRGFVQGFVEGSFVDAPYVASAPMCNTP